MNKKTPIITILMLAISLIVSIGAVSAYAADITADFDYNPARPSTADIVYFNDTSYDPNNNITSWLWDFGDGTNYTTTNITMRNTTHKYDDNGSYIVNLTVSDGDGNFSSKNETVIVLNVPPVAVDDTASTKVNEDVDINVVNNDYDTDGGIDENSVSIVSGSGPSHGTVNVNSGVINYDPDFDYTGVDTFTYNLKDDDGNTSNNAFVNVTVNPNQAPNADFSYSPSVAVRDSAVSFNDQSIDDGVIVAWYWDFDDGDISTLENPNHVFDDIGTFTISLTVEDGDGATDIVQKQIEVRNALPNADANGPYSAKVGETITFDGGDSSDSDGYVYRYRWDFDNDGTWDTPQLSSSTTTYSYDSSGNYDVKLLVIDNDGGQNTDFSSATIEGLVPTADAGGPYFGIIDETIYFDGSNSTDQDGTITIYSWDFGDGNSSTGATTSHVYTSVDSYIVTLTVEDDEGKTDTDTANVVISKPNHPPSNPEVQGNIEGNQFIEYTFEVMSTDPDGDQLQYIINWGDTTPEETDGFYNNATTAYITHTFTKSGEFTLSFKASDGDKESAWVYHTILIDICMIDDMISGCLIDQNSDGVYDLFHNESNGENTTVEETNNGNYLIDDDRDEKWDYTYVASTETVEVYTEPKNKKTKDTAASFIENPIIIIGLIVIIGIALAAVFIYKKKSKQTDIADMNTNQAYPERPEKNEEKINTFNQKDTKLQPMMMAGSMDEISEEGEGLSYDSENNEDTAIKNFDEQESFEKTTETKMTTEEKPVFQTPTDTKVHQDTIEDTSMNFCTECGAKLSGDQKFCTECGNKLFKK